MIYMYLEDKEPRDLLPLYAEFPLFRFLEKHVVVNYGKLPLVCVPLQAYLDIEIEYMFMHQYLTMVLLSFTISYYTL